VDVQIQPAPEALDHRHRARPPVADSVATGAVPLEAEQDTHMHAAWGDGTRQLVFEPLELLEKLAALGPRPRINLVLYHGVLAPHSGWRARVVAYSAPPAAVAVASACPEATNESPAGRSPPGVGRSDAPALRHRRAGLPALRRAASVDRDGRGP
jgi:hypothetical protein